MATSPLRRRPSLAQPLPEPAVHLAQDTWTWTVHTDVFDGPLDLLLYLVRRDGVDLRTMSVAPIAESYLAYLTRLKALNIALASDYLVMAATLCHLKSLELLPRPPAMLEEEDAIDPREELARRLEAYEKVKAAADALDARPVLGRDTVRRDPIDDGELDRPWIPGVDAFRLLDLYYGVLTRPVPEVANHTIHRPEVDLTACCRHVLRSLGGVGGQRELSAVLRSLPTRAERVVTFLAVLEMTRLGWLDIVQQGHLQPVAVTSQVPVDQDLGAVRGEDEPLAEAG